MKLNSLLLIVIILLMSLYFISNANNLSEDSLKVGWNNSAVGKLNFTQASFDNWTRGGENNWSWLFNINGLTLKKQEKFTWTNSGKVEFGQSKSGDEEEKKSADELFLESEFAYNWSKTIYGYTAVNGRTQFVKGYDFTTKPKVVISKFLNPGYFIQSAGLKYDPVPYFNSRFGFALKQTVVTDDEFALRYTDKIGTEKIEQIRSEAGLESVSNLTKMIGANSVFAATLEIFSNLKRFKEIDVRWDNLITAEVTKYIAFSFSFQIYYDRDLSRKRQFKQYLGVGLKYSLL
jgi:hypothetical protein